MSAVAALCVLLCIYAVSELIAQRTKAVFSTVLGVAILLLAGFWSQLLPSSLLDDAQVLGLGNVIAGLLIVSLGTTIDFPELKRQWKVVVASLVGLIGAVAAIIVVGGLLMERSLAIAGAPIFAGGSAATLIMTSALAEKGLASLSTFCVVLYVTQKFIGIPVASLLMRREAKRFLANPAEVAAYQGQSAEQTSAAAKRRLFQLPAAWGRPSVYLAKMALVAWLANVAAGLTGGRLHYFVVCLIMGALFFALGFLDQNILAKTQANGLITFLVTIIIFSNLATTTPQDVVEVIVPLLISAACGVAGLFLAGLLCARLLKMSLGLAVSLGITCTFGFPTTMLMPKEIAEAIGQTEAEKSAVEQYLLPKMLTAGFVTVTIASVLIAGVVVNLL